MSSFYFEITLTKKGLENVNDVLKASFAYLNKMKQIGPQQSIFD